MEWTELNWTTCDTLNTFMTVRLIECISWYHSSLFMASNRRWQQIELNWIQSNHFGTSFHCLSPYLVTSRHVTSSLFSSHRFVLKLLTGILLFSKHPYRCPCPCSSWGSSSTTSHARPDHTGFTSNHPSTPSPFHSNCSLSSLLTAHDHSLHPHSMSTNECILFHLHSTRVKLKERTYHVASWWSK